MAKIAKAKQILRVRVILEGPDGEVWIAATPKDELGNTWGPFHGALSGGDRAAVRKGTVAILDAVGVRHFTFVETLFSEPGISGSDKKEKQYFYVHCRTDTSPRANGSSVREVMAVHTLDELLVMLSGSSDTTKRMTKKAIVAAKLLRGSRHAYAAAGAELSAAK